MKLRLRVHKHNHAEGPIAWPGHLYDLRIADHYTPDIQQAIRHGLHGTNEAIEQARESIRSLPLQRAANSAQQGQQGLVLQIATQAVAQNAYIQPHQLTRLISLIYGDSYLVGTHSAGQLLPNYQVVQYLSPVDQGINWEHWEPGNPAAALRASEGGLARLLAIAGQTIRGINGTTLDQLGNAIGRGLLAGESTEQVRQRVRDYVDNPVRSDMISRTETARAVTAATFDTYREAGITKWGWLPAPDACPICLSNAHGSPYAIGSGPYMPAHPRCRCAAIPILG